MKAHELAKQHGLKTLKQVSELTGQSKQTLINWNKDKPALFEVVLLGCAAKLITDDKQHIPLKYRCPVTGAVVIAGMNEKEAIDFLTQKGLVVK